MRLIIGTICLLSSIGAAMSQTSTPGAQAGISEQIRVDSFQLEKRADSYGIANFVISNTTDRALNSIELNCWMDDDREHGTKVLVWPTPRSIPAHEQQKFSKVNIGLVGLNSRPQSEVIRPSSESGPKNRHRLGLGECQSRALQVTLKIEASCGRSRYRYRVRMKPAVETRTSIFDVYCGKKDT